MTDIDFPYQLNDAGRTASTDYYDHVRDMIEQFLFTSAGDRVNRPEFGSGLLERTFEPNRAELAATLQHNIQAGLQRWLGDVITIQSLVVTGVDSTLAVELVYIVNRDISISENGPQTQNFQWSSA